MSTDVNTSRIGASIEVSAKHVLDSKLEVGILPAQTRVYITDVGIDPVADIVNAARMVTDMGYKTVPHLPARRIESANALNDRLSCLVNEAGVDDILLIAGEADRQMGPFSQTLAILQTGIIDKLGISHVAIAGHPEGNEAYNNQPTMDVLREKYDFAKQMNAEMRIVTQFGFDGRIFVDWAKSVVDTGIDLPIHLGVAGPAKITTLIKYSAMCGVGNSLNFLKKRTAAIAHLATKHSPESVVEPIEQAWREGQANIIQLHVFPFGGLKNSAEWLTNRGTFSQAMVPNHGNHLRLVETVS